MLTCFSVVMIAVAKFTVTALRMVGRALEVLQYKQQKNTARIVIQVIPAVTAESFGQTSKMQSLIMTATNVVTLAASKTIYLTRPLSWRKQLIEAAKANGIRETPQDAVIRLYSQHQRAKNAGRKLLLETKIKTICNRHKWPYPGTIA